MQDAKPMTQDANLRDVVSERPNRERTSPDRGHLSEAEKRILQNQIDIMWVLHRFMGKHEPDLVGRGGELDAMRSDLAAACKASKKLLETGKGN